MRKQHGQALAELESSADIEVTFRRDPRFDTWLPWKISEQYEGAIPVGTRSPMPSTGRACHELRVLDVSANWRILYHVAVDAVVILAVFQKKTRATPVPVIRDCHGRPSTFQATSEQGRGKR